MMIELRHVTKSYGSLLLLKDVSASFGAGSVHLLTGRNGCGKSTLLRLIAGLTPVTDGEIAFENDDAVLGYLGHATFLYPGLTALENLSFWQASCGRPAKEDRLMAMLDQVGLLSFTHSRAGIFSRGMAQRLSLARVLLLEPDILLLDEPETGLDTASRSLLEDEVGKAAARGACILWVSHQGAEQKLGDVVWELSRRQLSVLSDRTGRKDAGEAAC